MIICTGHYLQFYTMQCVDTIHMVIGYLKDVDNLVNLSIVSQLTNCVCSKYLDTCKSIHELGKPISASCNNCYRGAYEEKLKDFFNIIVQNKPHKIHAIKNLWCQTIGKKLCYHSILDITASLSNQLMIDLAMRYIIEKVTTGNYTPRYVFNRLKDNDYIIQHSNFRKLITIHRKRGYESIYL